MRIGILGSGLMGGKLGTILARAGHEVVFSYARTKEKPDRLARDAGKNASAGTPADAARDADALLLAVHWSRTDDVLKKAGPLSGGGSKNVFEPPLCNAWRGGLAGLMGDRPNAAQKVFFTPVCDPARRIKKVAWTSRIPRHPGKEDRYIRNTIC